MAHTPASVNLVLSKRAPEHHHDLTHRQISASIGVIARLGDPVTTGLD
jgi:hypothetical protein